MNENRIKSLIQLNSIIGVLPEEKKKNIPIGILREIENAQLDGYIFKYWVDKHNNKVENKNDGLLISNVGGMKEKSLISLP